MPSIIQIVGQNRDRIRIATQITPSENVVYIPISEFFSTIKRDERGNINHIIVKQEELIIINLTNDDECIALYGFGLSDLASFIDDAMVNQ
jgi:hypothetical protein